MQLTIKSRKLDRELTFSRPGKGYIYVDLNGQAGTQGNQICEGGRTLGSTISYGGNSEAEFERICRRWYRALISDTITL